MSAFKLTSIRRLPYFLSEAMASLAGTFLTLGVCFYTTHRFGFTAVQNLCLVAGQGTVYTLSALLADRLSRKLGRRRTLVCLHLGLTFIALVGAAISSPVLLVADLLVYTFLLAANWPMLESLVSDSPDAAELSRLISIYNLVWSSTGAVSFAVCGTLIEYWSVGVFLIPAAAHLCAAIIMGRSLEFNGKISAATTQQTEDALLRQRRLALTLSRITLPATYVIIYSLSALMPTLVVIGKLSPTVATLLCSFWLGARWLMFLFLGATSWWHTRPRVLLVASVLMLLAFLGIVLPGNRATLWSHMDQHSLLAWICVAQVALGVTLGMIYTASLYFGMVLSEGSTEHGGYHEALIGLGSVLGPGAGAIAAWVRPNDISLSIAAVSSVTALSVVAAMVAGVVLKPRNVKLK